MRTQPRSNLATMPRPTISEPLPDIVGLGGAIAGLIAGLAMALTAAILSATINGSIWLEAKQIAAPFFGPEVIRPGFEAGPVFTGTVLHFATATLLGSVYSVLFRRVLNLPSDMGVPLLLGLVYGALVWAIAYFIVLPIINPFLLGTYGPAFVVQHLIYGLVLGLTYSVLRPLPYVLQAPRER